MKIGIASDHGGYELKEIIHPFLTSLGHDVVDFGPDHLDNADDYPDYVIPMAKAVAAGTVERGIAICGSGVGACIAANKVHGARAALIGDHFSAHQGVEDDNMNIICLGGRITGYAVAEELVDVFLKAQFTGLERHNRRIAKVKELDK
ncbi:RpiB/LacA/LacB family sugar-phosphate isomerase [uncultured Mucilaginibacter sp.]|uniref:RpiB/LacA/LacB family sugar-phosphate isomerase n=1 Tax=uncultured Mucilaginibacter sp. TaxID=797541 RepID=UPI0025E99D51|nr:RpiB/LacA/LacB family sugar-phosphate isomerase [uncultured Mucilaginibacter sp.]